MKRGMYFEGGLEKAETAENNDNIKYVEVEDSVGIWR